VCVCVCVCVKEENLKEENNPRKDWKEDVSDRKGRIRKDNTGGRSEVCRNNRGREDNSILI